MRTTGWWLAAAALAAAGCTSEPEPASGAAPGPQAAPAAASVEPGAAAAPRAVAVSWPDTTQVSSEGRLVFAGQPGPEGLRHARQDGVTLVVNLRTPEEMGAKVSYDEAAEAEALGLRYVTIPVRPADFTAAQVDAFARAYQGSEGKVLVHCGSSNRVGGMWAAYLERHEGVPLPEALERGRAAGLRDAAMIEAVERVAESE